MGHPSSPSSEGETSRVFTSMSPSVTTIEAAATMTSMATQFNKQSSSAEVKLHSRQSQSSRMEDLPGDDDTSSVSTEDTSLHNSSSTVAPDAESVGSTAGESCEDSKGGNLSSSSSSSSSHRNKKKRNRTSRACVHCRVAHAACSNERPCARCVRLDLECYDACRKRRRWTVNSEDGGNNGNVSSPKTSTANTDISNLDSKTSNGTHYSGAGFAGATPCSTRCATNYNQPTPILPRCTTFFPPPKSCKPFCGTVCQLPASASPSSVSTPSLTSSSGIVSGSSSNNQSRGSSPSSQHESSPSSAANRRLPPLNCIPATYAQQNCTTDSSSSMQTEADSTTSNGDPKTCNGSSPNQESSCDINVKKENTDPAKLRTQLMEEQQRLICEMHRTLAALGNVHAQIAELDRNNS